MNSWFLPNININKCNQCGLCVNYCPTKAINFLHGSPKITNEKDCAYCGICEDTCPKNAIFLEYYILPSNN